jgi:hypothetical protein
MYAQLAVEAMYLQRCICRVKLPAVLVGPLPGRCARRKSHNATSHVHATADEPILLIASSPFVLRAMIKQKRAGMY